MELGECYVCTDACDTLSPCKCKNLFLHENCYAMLLLYENKKCGVCLEDYPLVDIKPITTIVQEEEEEEIEPNPLWIFCPIMMRPQPFKLKAIYMGLDVLIYLDDDGGETCPYGWIFSIMSCLMSLCILISLVIFIVWFIMSGRNVRIE